MTLQENNGEKTNIKLVEVCAKTMRDIELCIIKGLVLHDGENRVNKYQVLAYNVTFE